MRVTVNMRHEDASLRPARLAGPGRDHGRTPDTGTPSIEGKREECTLVGAPKLKAPGDIDRPSREVSSA